MLESLGIINFRLFVVGVIMIMVTPGPNSLFVLSTAARFGKKAGLKAMVGVAGGDALLMFLASAGVAAAVRANPGLFEIVRYAGAAYLFLLGARVLYIEIRQRSGATPPGEDGEAGRGGAARRAAGGRLLLSSFLVSLSNPNTIIFYIAFFVQFVSPERSGEALPFFLLALTVQAISMSYLGLLVAAGARLAAWLREYHGVTRLFRYALGLLFVGFGLRLALAGLDI